MLLLVLHSVLIVSDPLLAFRKSKEKNFSLSARIYRACFESIPLLGIPVALVYPVWKIMRCVLVLILFVV
jgi:hypothetical protein